MSGTYGDNIICPHCGYEFADSWEIGMNDDGDFEVECHGCQREFVTTRTTTVSYSSRSVETRSPAERRQE